MKQFALSGAVVLAAASAATAGTVTFDNGNEGWLVNGYADIVDIGGSNGNVVHQYQYDGFFQEIRNDSNPEYLGDWTAKGSLIEISIDIRVNTLRATFNPSVVYPRELVLEFRDHSNPEANAYGLPYASIWSTSSSLMDSTVEGFVTHTWLLDTTAVELPAGWGGYGYEDPNTYEPLLPDGVTVQDILQNVDELMFTTAVPGYYYGFTEWDFEVDNIRVSVVPAPGVLSCAGLFGVAALRRRRHG